MGTADGSRHTQHAVMGRGAHSLRPLPPPADIRARPPHPSLHSRATPVADPSHLEGRDCALTVLVCCHPQSMPTLVAAASDTVEISPLFLATATGSLLFIFIIVATVVVNFGIMKKN